MHSARQQRDQRAAEAARQEQEERNVRAVPHSLSQSTSLYATFRQNRLQQLFHSLEVTFLPLYCGMDYIVWVKFVTIYLSFLVGLATTCIVNKFLAKTEAVTFCWE